MIDFLRPAMSRAAEFDGVLHDDSVRFRVILLPHI